MKRPRKMSLTTRAARPETSPVVDAQPKKKPGKATKKVKVIRFEARGPAAAQFQSPQAADRSPNQPAYLVVGEGDVYVYFELETQGFWQSSMAVPLVPRQDHRMSDQRIALLGTEATLRNTSKEWLITIENTLSDKDVDYEGRVALVQADSAAEALIKVAAPEGHLYDYPIAKTIAKAGASPLEKGLVSFF